MVVGRTYMGSLVRNAVWKISPLIETRLLLPDLTPNAGLWWYFFTEMFDHFRAFFLVAFTVSQHQFSARKPDAQRNVRRTW